ncbi:DUF1404 domain-containing protein [Sulfuracidifex tepidarius]|uniref:DUF1404 domain-containing protein n=1 Tax=Sulfuracidifex tepidarius TaxID=1294262 RepID=A0A510DX65_9CREN|nr:DUF1404 domain-containing protein [Sulfuracidifex tepidarius]BBG24779.1 hypothetical protein IC006_2113 [Sulfuracidifex tepidarius]BBG27565.1 hypothetical protein IC007_2119 [Sulfuracidifex tepidarius]
MLEYNGRKFSVKNLALPSAFVIAFVNPFVERLQFYNPVAYMLDHYALYAAGAIIGYLFFKGSPISFLIGIIPAVFWHIPLFFALGASFIQYRVLCELTLFLGGILAGSYINSMSLGIKVTSLGLYMLGDSLLSIFFILGYPQYSNVDYSYLSWGPSSLPIVGITMFVVMNIVLIYTIIKIMQNAMIF